MQDLNDMGYFAEVAQRGSFAAAARALGLPKSRLSRRIARLEAQLGVRLLQRTTRKLSLTTVGEMYLRHCVAICDEAQAASDAVAQASSEPRGVVRLSCPVTLAQSVVGALLPEFMGRHPLVRIQMEVSNRAVDVIEEGFDIALRVRTTLSASGSLVVKHLGLSQTLLVASPQQIRRQGAPRSPEELAAMDTVAMSPTDGRHAWKLLGPQGADFLTVHQPRYVADDLPAVKLAVLAGIGVGMLPDYMCREELAEGRLVVALPQWSLEPGIVHAVFPSRRGLVPAVRLLLDFIGERMAQACERANSGAARLDAAPSIAARPIAARPAVTPQALPPPER